MDAKRVAAVAGVLRYLARREAAAGQGAQARAEAVAANPSGSSPWAQFGRQAIMNQRIWMQTRRRT